MAYYDDKLDVISLHFFTIKQNTSECMRVAANEKDMRLGDVLDLILSSIPTHLRDFYISITHITANADKIKSLMKMLTIRQNYTIFEYSPDLLLQMFCW